MVRMTRVLLVGKAAPEKGGIATFIEMLFNSSLSQTFELRLHNLARPLGEEMGQLSLANVRRTIADVFSVYRASRWADVVHLHSAFVPSVTIVRAGLLVLAARAASARVIVHVHGGLFPEWLDDGGSRHLVKAALRGASSIVVVSTAVEDRLADIVGRSKVRLIRNGVEVERFAPEFQETPASPEVPVVGFVGMITRRKGLLDLFAASRMLTESGMKHRVLVVGGTPPEGATEERLIHEAQHENIEFAGSIVREQVHEYYAKFDIYCLPSWWEAAPLSLLEAMSAGLPVVATRVGDVERIVDDQRTGLLVPVKEPEILASALRKLLSDPGLRRQMGAAGRVKALKEFDLERTVAEMSHLYRGAS